MTSVSVDPKNSDQITVINQDPQVSVEEYDDQVDANPVVVTDADPVLMTDADPVVTVLANPVVIADPVDEVMCNVNNTPAVDSQATEKSLIVGDHKKVAITSQILWLVCVLM